MDTESCDRAIVRLIRAGKNLVCQGQQQRRQLLEHAAHEERRWQQAAQAKFDEAYTLLVQTYHERALAFAQRKLPDQHKAEEVVQIAFKGAWKNLSSFQGSAKGASLVWGWFVGILVHKVMDFYRGYYAEWQASPHQQKPKELVEAFLRQYCDADSSPSHADPPSQVTLMVDQAFGRLSEREKLILRLHYMTRLAELTREQKATILGVQPGSLGTLKQRALDHFVDVLRDIGGQGPHE